jgi:hypothetical protein
MVYVRARKAWNSKSVQTMRAVWSGAVDVIVVVEALLKQSRGLGS